MSHNAEIEISFEYDLPWFGVWTWHAWEQRVFRGLHDAGLNPYLPRRRETVIRNKRKVNIEVPLFRGYCFVRPIAFDAYAQRATLDTEGVGGILTNNGAPVPIPPMQLANPFYADILAYIKGLDPYHSAFKSKSQRRREKKQKAWLERLRAA